LFYKFGQLGQVKNKKLMLYEEHGGI